jgi:hypothetical protein
MTCGRGVLVMPMLLFAAGCADDMTCPAWSFPAVQVNLESAATGSPIVGALGEVQDGEYHDSLVDLGNGSYMAAENNPGTYNVNVESPGYSPGIPRVCTSTRWEGPARRSRPRYSKCGFSPTTRSRPLAA